MGSSITVVHYKVNGEDCDTRSTFISVYGINLVSV